MDLADTLKEKGYEQIETKLTSILEKTVKENSYFKFKSGLFSTKVDRDKIIDQVLDSLPADSTDLAKKALEELDGSSFAGREIVVKEAEERN